MKYFEIIMTRAESFEGVVCAEDEAHAQEKHDDGEFTENFRFCPEQAQFEYKEISKEEYEAGLKYCKST
jgi:hypothetical protein